MFRNCTLLSKIKTVSESRWIYTIPRLLKDAGSGENGNKSDPAAKLNALLLNIIKEDKRENSVVPKIEIPKPRLKLRTKKLEKKNLEKKEDKKNLGSRIVDAAKDVADKIEGDKKEIEAQLLHKLLYKTSSVKDEILKASVGNQSLTDLLSKMDVEPEEKTTSIPMEVRDNEFSRASQVKNLTGKRAFRDKPIPRREQRVNLFGEKPLGIFKSRTEDKGIQLKTWTACETRERKLSVTHPPSNYFEQLIDWTEKGVIWKFPIDNEQDLDAERNVSFASHVLLENHLEGWCPTTGPIRHFMELVCVGLSRNHWLLADEKEQHILWYKEFFLERRQLIKDLGAGEIPEVSETNTSPQ